MREIKFKAWDKATNQFVEEHARLYLNGCVSVCGGWATKDIILLQYTGKKDIEGVEVYEGDIVLVGVRSSPHIILRDVVCWDDELCGFHCDYVTYFPDDIKVIGNIYQNPELLENK